MKKKGKWSDVADYFLKIVLDFETRPRVGCTQKVLCDWPLKIQTHPINIILWFIGLKMI